MSSLRIGKCFNIVLGYSFECEKFIKTIIIISSLCEGIVHIAEVNIACPLKPFQNQFIEWIVLKWKINNEYFVHGFRTKTAKYSSFLKAHNQHTTIGKYLHIFFSLWLQAIYLNKRERGE